MTVPDYADRRPAKVQIADDLRQQIRSGKYGPEDKLPPVRTLAADYHVVTETIRDALDILRREGIVETRSTRGTFVLQPPGEPEPSPEFTKIMQRLDEMEAQIRRQTERIDELEQQRLRGQSGRPASG